jgi:hypothetical protein
MALALRSVSRVAWPSLAWAARITPDGGVSLFAGADVERTPDGLSAAAWSGPFATSSPFDATTSIGTALRLLPDRIEALCGNAGPDVLFLHRGAEGVVLANALPVALAVAGDEPLPDYPFYNHDLMAYLLGGPPVGIAIPTRRGSVTPAYRAISLEAPAWRATPLPTRPPHASSFPPHPAPLPPHPSSLPPHASPLPPHASSLPPHPAPLPPHASSFPPHPASLPPHASSLPPPTAPQPPHATPLPLRPMPRCPDFAAYRAMLAAETAALFANAADPARGRRFRPIATVSSGYDSVAAAVIARDAGCTEALTWREASMAEPGTLDSGEDIAARLGLAVTALTTHAYRARTDLPEIEFIAAGYGGPQAMMAGSEPQLAGALLVTGFAGDQLWDRDFARRRAPRGPAICGGFSAVNFHLRLPALAVAVPMIGMADDPADLGRLSRAAEMAPWTLGGDYDRPLARRIAEEAGLPRGSFASRKLMATPAYATLGRGRLPVEGFLGDASAAAFRAWLAAHGGIEAQAARRNRLVAPLARLFWTGALPRALGRAGLPWPPAPRAVWRLRQAVRDTSLMFQWAMEMQLTRVRFALDTRCPEEAD